MPTQFFKLFGRLFSGKSASKRNTKSHRRAGQSRPDTRRILRVEGLERRELMAVMPIPTVPNAAVAESALVGPAIAAPAVTAASSSNEMRVLVPAYFYPSEGGSPWTQLDTSAKSVPITAIMNPDSGPGTAVNSDYVAAVDKLQAAGGQVVGYVDSGYGTIPLGTVEAEIKDYALWYHVNGVFIDDMSSVASTQLIQYYQTIDQYAHSLQSGWTVVGNPGDVPPQAYGQVADVLVDYEQDTGYGTFAPPNWQPSLSAQHFANIVDNVTSVSAMQTDVSLAAQRNTGWLYVTNLNDLNGANPYGALPSYWSQFVSAVQATPIVISDPATQFGVTASTTSATAGSAFSVTIKAVDNNNNVVSSFSGPVTLTASDGQPIHISAGSLNMTNGVATVTITLDKAESLSLLAVDGSLKGSCTVVVKPAAVASYVVTAPSRVAVGADFSINVTLRDAFGNTVTAPTMNVVTITSSDPKAANLGTFDVTSVNGSFAISNLMLKTAGGQSLTVTLNGSAKVTLALTVGSGFAPL